MSATVGEYIGRMKQIRGDFVDDDYLKSLKGDLSQISYAVGQLLANQALKVIADLEIWLQLSRVIEHEHIGTPEYISYTKIIRDSGGSARLDKIIRPFDTGYSLENYITGANEAFAFLYMTAFTCNLLSNMEAVVAADDKKHAAFLATDYSTKMSIPMPGGKK
ncbi:hypothetical protein [Rhizobium leguminosarum]|uniref:hypothetical protein n=1 Tax=Rhizobium leguminosarum TaxID=384 RepID=UPI001C918CD7|nr:hypothetical protein [Rhizobium leguminosarum]MBY2986680.1 hypothetical protein [Rhizobium leguminosarum]